MLSGLRVRFVGLSRCIHALCFRCKLAGDKYRFGPTGVRVGGHRELSLPQGKFISLTVRGQVAMSDDAKDVIEFAIRSAFVSYPKDDDPDWRSPHWITPKECAYLAMAVILELQVKGFEIVKKAT